MILKESKEQEALFEWAELVSGTYPELKLLFAIPNGSHKSIATAMRFKREGLKPGVPDICLPVARGDYHGLYIELKRVAGGKLSVNQGNWLNALNEQGYFAVECEGFDKAREVIERYLKKKIKSNVNT